MTATRQCPPHAAELQDLRQRLSAATGHVESCGLAVAAARRERRRRAVRAMLADTGLPPWVLAFIAGSVGGFSLPVLVSAVVPASAGVLLACIAMGYALVGGLTFVLGHDHPGETDDNRREHRRARLAEADHGLELAVVDLEVAEHDRDAIDAEFRRLHRLAYASKSHPGPADLQRAVAGLFVQHGFAVEWTVAEADDFGVDLVAARPGERWAIRVATAAPAGTTAPVGTTAVQQVFAGMAHYGCDRSAIVTAGRFAPAAVALAGSTGCVLVDGEALRRMSAGAADHPFAQPVPPPGTTF